MFLFVFVGHRTIIARYAAKWGITQTCLCENKCKGGRIAPFWGIVDLAQKVSPTHGYMIYCCEILWPPSKWNPVWNPGWKPHSWKMLICMLRICFVKNRFGYFCCHAWVLSSETLHSNDWCSVKQVWIYMHEREWDWPWNNNDFQVVCISHFVVHVLSVQAPPATCLRNLPANTPSQWIAYEQPKDANKTP